MKTLVNYTILTVVGAAMLSVSVAQSSPPAPPPFMEALSSHGTWRHETGYGWHWRPYEADRTSGWRPYLSSGYWKWTGEAWSWTSDHVWGATVFHFGRWANIPAKGGWVWIPGNEYAPAWVQWIQVDGYWGWAPTPSEPGYAPGFALSIQLQPEDFTLVPEGALAGRNLETIAVFGVRPGTPPQVQAPVVVQQQYPQQQQYQVVQSPVYVTPSYVSSPVIIREETRYVGPTVWWNWNYSSSSCRYCGGRHSGGCPSPSHSYPRSHSHSHTHSNPRLVPRHTAIQPAPAPTPRHVPVQSRPNVNTAPIQSGTPTSPNIHRPPPSPAPSRRGSGVQDILNQRR